MTLSKPLNEYDNLLLARDLNINTLRPTSDSFNHLYKGSLIDLMSTNKTQSFYKSHSFVTGLSDCHKLIVSILRTSFQKLPP